MMPSFPVAGFAFFSFMHARPSMAVKRGSVMGRRVRRDVLPPIAREDTTQES